MSKFISAVHELKGKKVRFYLGGGDRGYVQGPVEKVEDDLIYILKEGEIRGTMHAITLNAKMVLFYEMDIVTRTDTSS
ncbi:MAG: hypothetical protein V3T86_14010 [Planctomycetota bacterium]